MVGGHMSWDDDLTVVDQGVWQRYEYGDDLVLWQRACPDCDKGMLLAPARFCGRCGGTGYLVTAVDPTGELPSSDGD
jgi:ribosomal protein S27AE